MIFISVDLHCFAGIELQPRDEMYSLYVKFGLLYCVRYNGDFVIPNFVISRFCSIHFTVTLAGLNNIIRYRTHITVRKE